MMSRDGDEAGTAIDGGQGVHDDSATVLFGATDDQNLTIIALMRGVGALGDRLFENLLCQFVHHRSIHHFHGTRPCRCLRFRLKSYAWFVAPVAQTFVALVRQVAI